MIARVRGVIAASMAGRIEVVGRRTRCRPDGLPPSSATASAVATKVKARRDHFVPAPDAERHQAIRSASVPLGAADAVGGAGISGELLLQLGDLRAQDVLAVSRAPAAMPPVDLRAGAAPAGRQVDERASCGLLRFESRAPPPGDSDRRSPGRRPRPRRPAASRAARRRRLIQPICRAGTPTISAKSGTSLSHHRAGADEGDSRRS